MNEGLIPSRYAKALYKYAFDKNEAERVYIQMKQLDNSYECASALKSTIDNPYLKAADKEKVLCTAAGSNGNDCLTRFFKLVIQNNRENLMRNMAIAYQDIYRRENSIERVVITTAVALPDEEYSRIQSIVEKLEKGKTLEYVKVVNPDIIGGFSIRVETKILDATIKNEIKKLRLKLLS
ncbi:MAG: F0F1 ATP synthase subunit delta [Muribaculaceae bacterium]|nr:F0F1 ATP synthase subunit delta [Muribaculaceae bacterium]